VISAFSVWGLFAIIILRKTFFFGWLGRYVRRIASAFIDYRIHSFICKSFGKFLM
jgi:hypothetical protein